MDLDMSSIGGAYQIFVDQDTLSIYVSWTLSNDVIRIDDEEPYTFYQYSRHSWLVSVGTVGGGPIGGPSSAGDGDGLMASTSEQTADTTPATSYGYALDGRRVGKAGYVNMKYLYDGENVVYELWDDMTVRFTHPVKSGSCGSCGSCGNTGSIFFTDHPISITIYNEFGEALKYYYLYDGLGSVTELIDTNENVVNIYRYTPFGDALVREETVYNPHQYTGRQYDAESGLYHYRARAYSADIGRFMQQDPAGMVDGANMYAYVGWNPVNQVDPTGMGWWCNFKCGLLGGIFVILVTAVIASIAYMSGNPALNMVFAISAAMIFGSAVAIYCVHRCKGTSKSALLSIVIAPFIAVCCGLLGMLWPLAGVVCTWSFTVVLALASATLY